MKLFLHIGSPKAASSFLQTLCARSRCQLAAAGIHYAVGTPHDEDCMLAGRISAGNALHLARFIREGQWDRADQWLARVATAAQAQNCDRILLSSEWLLGALAHKDRMVEFCGQLKQSGHEPPEILLILRDPVGQFISLYKHRAKGGTVGSIDAWASAGYDLPQRLARIRKQLDPSGAQMTVRGYGKAPGSLERVFFTDWLEVPIPADGRNLLVNPSLSLSELVLIRQLRAARPSLVPFLYERLLAVDPAQKSESQAMKDYAAQVAAHAVARHAGEWQKWNMLLPEPERLRIPEQPGVPGPEPKDLVLSAAQWNALTELIADASRPGFLWNLFWAAQLRPALGRIKRLLFPWHSRR